MAIQKITGDVIATSAVTADSLADTTITAAKLHTTLDLTGKTVTVSTASAGDNDTTVASTAFVATAVANLADSAPAALNTLNELAAALGDDANFSTTVTNSIALKAPLASPTFTGTINSGAITSTSGITASGPFRSGGVDNYILFDYDGDFTGGNYYAIQDTSANRLRISYGFSATDNLELDASGNFYVNGGNTTFAGTLSSGNISIPASGTDGTSVEVGLNSSSNHFAYIDLIGDSTYTDYGLRLIRGNSGANTNSGLYHRGTGSLLIETQEAAIIGLRTAGSAALTLDASQNATFAGTIDSGAITSSGNITADYDDTISLNYSVSNGSYHKGMSGTSFASGNTARGLHLFNFDNDSNLGINFWVGTTASKQFAGKIDESGNFGIGTSSPSSFHPGARQLVVGSGSGEQGITLYGGSDATSYLLFADGTSGAEAYAGQVNYNHATNTLNFCTNKITTPRMTIDSSGKLLVGATSNTSRGSGATKALIKLGSGESYFDIQASSTSANSDILFSDGAGGHYGIVGYQHSTDSMLFYTASEERMRIDSAGTMILRADSAANLGRIQFSSQAATYQILGGNNIGYLGYKTGGYHRWFGSDGAEDWRINSSGHFTPGQQHAMDIGGTNAEVRNIYAQGISFASNANASGMASELLDDYEEGTWTPTLGTEAVAGSGSSGNNNNKYVKIGRLVHVTGWFNAFSFSSITSGTYVMLRGLPFRPEHHATGFRFTYTQANLGGGTYGYGHTSLYACYILVGGSTGAPVHLTRAAISAPSSATTHFMFYGTYYTAD